MNTSQKYTVMKSLLQFVDNHTSHPTALACRALLVLALFIGGGMSVQAQDLDLMPYLRNGWTWNGNKTNNGDGSVTYTSVGEWQGVVAANINMNLSEYEKVVVEFSNVLNSEVQVLVRRNGNVAESGLKNGVSSIECPINNVGVVGEIAIQPHYSTTFTITALYAVKPLPDPFLNSAKDNMSTTTGTRQIERTDATADVAWTTSTTASPKYARVYLTDINGEKLESWNTNLLEVKYDGVVATPAGQEAKNGVYVYNADGLDKSKLSVTLKAGARQFPRYRVVTLFSTDDGTFVNGVMTQEPQWDEQYTYSFTYQPRPNVLAVNIDDPNLKTKYKTLRYTNNNGTLTFTPQLLTNWYEVAGDCDASRADFANKGYVRWYLLNTTNNTIITAMSLTAPNNVYTNTYIYGYYRYQFAAGDLDRDGSDAYNPTFQVQLPNGVTVNQVRLVCVATTLTDEFATDRSAEPEYMQVKYVYNLMTQTQLETLNDQTFVHYQGETHRPYQIVSGNPGTPEVSWDYSNGSIDYTTYTSQNIRQDVHQVDYYIYLNLQQGGTADLALPLEGWIKNEWYNDNPSGTEPLGFYRWYDWKSDMRSEYLQRAGGNNSALRITNRGFISNRFNNTPAGNSTFRNQIGVDFVVPAGFNNMDEIVIACDVSRYMDGMDDSKTYLVHEPTLSIRYLFHVMPAKTIADDIDAKSALLRTTEADLISGSKTSVTEDEINAMFKLTEDNGRVVVSLNGTEVLNEAGEPNRTAGMFTLRANLKELGHYFVYNGQNLVQGNTLKWYAYYQDADGALWKHEVDMTKPVPMYYAGDNGTCYYWEANPRTRSELRLAKYEMSDFLGPYTKLAPGNETMPLNSLPSGTNLHVVGCIGNGTDEKPVCSYDLVFLDDAPKPLGTATTQIEQTYATELNVGAVLTFDDLFSEDETIRLAKPTSSAENYALMPQQWPLGQYGYCYPSLYGQDASSWAIYHSYWNGYGIGPTHGDYMLLKSMNMPKVSYTAGGAGDENGTFDTQSYYAWWYSEIDGVEGQNRFPKLFDVTHERLYGKEFVNDGDNAQYGTYMYIDASDEARTYANLEFKAKLCAGAQIYYTAYIANMAPNVGQPENSGDHKAPPQVMFRVTTEVNGKRIPVVSFLTGDIESMGANKLGQWYMVSGHTKIPSELEYLLNGGERTYYVSIDNFAENTKGADYCVDEITFYTTSAKVRAYVESQRCTTDNGVEVKVYAEAESLLKALEDGTEQMNLFYRIYRMHEELNDDDHHIKDGEELTGPGVYTDGTGAANQQFGTVIIDKGFDLSTIPAYDPANPNALYGGITPSSGYYRNHDDGDKVYFQFVDRTFELEPEQAYFVSFYEFGLPSISDPNDWGNPYGNNICSVYSNKFYSNKVYLKPMEVGTEQEASGKIDFACGVTKVDVTYDLNLRYPNIDGTYVEYDNIHFDYFVGRVDWDDNDSSDDDPDAQVISAAKFSEVKAAVDALRTITTVALSHDELAEVAISGDFTQEMKVLLLSYMLGPDEQHPHRYPRLLLEASTQFEYSFTAPNGNYFQAMPIEKVTDGNEDICEQIELMFFVDDSSGGPKISLGFDDVDYPDNYKKQVVRVGLEQLRKMKEEGYLLHIPVRSFDNKKVETDNTDRKIYFPSDGAVMTLVAVDKNADVKVPATTDPVLLAKENPIGTPFAKIVSPSGGERAYVDKTHMYLPLDLSVCEIDFHEGYEYEVSSSFYDENDEGASDPCYGDLYLVIKVVPEFVTWDAHQIGNTEYYSASWYNDENWKRSTRAQLYKDKNGDGAQQNTPTPGHPGGYDDDLEIDSRLEGNPGYVPMKFTHVTLLTGNHAPSLIKELRVEAADGRSGADQGGSLIDPSFQTGTQMLTDPSPFTHLYSSYPTENIRYDMLVRYGDHAHGGEGCFGHRYIGENGWGPHTSGHGLADPNAKVFDVEKFYGNTCKDIYFKPGAELLRQQRLYYQKAWVERELEANRWSLVSTPLKSTYAGDMYVPTKMTDVSLETPAEVKGRQATEAFQPMNFSTTAVVADRTNKVSSQPAYSRTKYPIYQRSWATDGSLVWTKTDDIRRNNYSANLPYSSVSSVDVEWSHTYNDVQVPYHTLTGFSIRPHKQDQTLLSLIRLPKDDTSYQYFDWTDIGDPAGGQQTVDKSAIQNLTYYYGDNNPHPELSMYRLKVDDPQADGNYTVDVSDLQQQDGYLLVGNPTMASVNMSKFFEVNTDLARGYWTYENGALKAYRVSSDYTVTDSENNKGGIIKPLQAFFVKKGSASQISFTRGMAIDGNFPGDVIVPASPGGGSRPFGLVLSAAGVKGSSSAMVSQSGDASNDYVEGEDVETLFDSNLSDVPLVYTVADGRAVSIDNRQEISVIPFGVTQAMTAPVDVSVTGIATSMTPIYFVDALTGVSTELAENATVSVQPNDYGRYFLVRDPLTSSTKDVNGGIVISVRDGQVTVTASDNLSRVVAMSAGGVQTFAQKDCGRTCSFQLQSGIYIIEASTQSGSKTFKVMVK